MPYGISDSQSDCGGWATVKQNADGSYETIGCHESKQDAIDQMVAVSISEDIEPLGEVGRVVDAVLETREIDMTPPEYMRTSARRGLELHEQGYSGDGLMPATVTDARRMAAGEALSESKWRRIGPWIARHIVDLDAVQGDEITPGLVAMLLWGGGSSRASARRTQAYAEGIIRQLDGDGGTAVRVAMDYDAAVTDTLLAPVHWVRHDVTDVRAIAYTNLEVRADGEGDTLVGYAAVFDSPSEPMPFTEIVKRGAFAKTLNDGADVRLLIDHEGVPLARTKSGTLKLEEDERGLKVEATLDPTNPDAMRVISAMRRGDLSQMSFAFRTIKDSWSSDRMLRELREVQLYDVSVVTYPAYEDTIAELRRKADATVVTSGFGLARKRQLEIARYR